VGARANPLYTRWCCKVRLTMSGTHEGPLMGMPPTGRAVRQDHMHFVRYRDGKAVEHWGVRDDLGMMQQMGVIPRRNSRRKRAPPKTAALQLLYSHECVEEVFSEVRLNDPA
jgi:hypothetical protein